MVNDFGVLAVSLQNFKYEISTVKQIFWHFLKVFVVSLLTQAQQWNYKPFGLLQVKVW